MAKIEQGKDGRPDAGNPLSEADLLPYGDYAGGRPVEPELVGRFHELVYRHFALRGRSFPWRESGDPYRILVSEVMLQQTQTERVVTKYHQFTDRYPNFESLARASLADLLGLWSGLGYNRRAKSLLDTARRVVAEYGGELPADLAALRSLPGIGPYTAAAVLAFAFRMPVAVLDTNIRRVYLHYFFSKSDGVSDAEVMPLVEATLDRRDPRLWYFALMDLGAMLGRRLPNANTRSRHYIRQPPFERSNRQLRGGILKALAGTDGHALEELGALLPFDAKRIGWALDQLSKEGLVVCESGVYRIPRG